MDSQDGNELMYSPDGTKTVHLKTIVLLIYFDDVVQKKRFERNENILTFKTRK